jgi:cytochrome c2
VALEAADPVRGQQLTLTNACVGCHSTDPSMIMVGPTWNNLATTAETRIEGMSSGLYLYNSIIHPNDFVVEGYAPGLMLQIYGSLPSQDLADIIAYLLTLKEPA